MHPTRVATHMPGRVNGVLIIRSDLRHLILFCSRAKNNIPWYTYLGMHPTFTWGRNFESENPSLHKFTEEPGIGKLGFASFTVEGGIPTAGRGAAGYRVVGSLWYLPLSMSSEHTSSRTRAVSSGHVSQGGNSIQEQSPT